MDHDVPLAAGADDRADETQSAAASVLNAREQNEAALAGALGRFLNEERVEYCLLGSTDPACIDVVVAAAARARMPAVLQAFCARNELELVHYRRGPDRVESYELSTFAREGRSQFVTVDVRADYLRWGRILFTAEELLRDRVPASSLSDHDRGCLRAAPAREFLCRLLRCIDRGSISDRDASDLSERWRQDEQGVTMQVERFWNSSREGGVILRAAASGNWEPVQASLRALQSVLLLRGVVPPFAWLRGAFGRLGGWFHPTGLLIACLGPDGSGKRSVIRALSEQPLQPFRQVYAMELRPRLVRPGHPHAAGQKPKRTPRGRLGTLAKLMMFVADYWFGYWLRIRPRLVGSTLVVSDRYFDDVLVDPRRYRMRSPRAFARLLLRWIPRPELWLVFDVPPDVLKERRQDVAADEAARQRGEYRRLLRGHENLVVLDANQPLERVIAQAERAILTQLSRRTAARLGLPLDTTSNPTATRLLLFFCRRSVPLLSRLLRLLFNSDIQCRLPPDLHIPHPFGVLIHPQAAIGRRVTVMQQVTIGSKDATDNIAPIIGDDVYIGAGARVLGDVRIGQGAVIGANAVVTRDIPPGVTVVGANRIVATPRAALAGSHPDSSVAQFPIGVQRRTGKSG